MKRIYISCFLVVMLLSMFLTPVVAHDLEMANSDGVTIYYNIVDNAELEVTYCGKSYSAYPDEYSGNVIIPESVTYEGTTYPVTRINTQTFRNCTGLLSITIPNSVTNIENSAFYGCI